MVKWIDIVSPTLRTVHQLWCECRENNLIPHLTRYNTFAISVDQAVSLTAVFPANSNPPSFRSVGIEVHRGFPAVRNGMSFAQVEPIVIRTMLTVPFHEVHSSRQPDCRRSSLGRSTGTRRYEQLLLPFGDDRLRVCLVHALYMFEPGR